jgi:glycosyltransferase involved in cell wall biosynthesis
MTRESGVPRVSLGLPVYNGERYLRAAVDSLLGQTFEDFELIISDNASTDGTEDICRGYAAADPRVRYVRQPRNIGANPNHNAVIRLARAPYVKWCSYDDVCAPEYLERALAALEKDPAAVLCHSRSVLMDEHGERLRGDGTAFYLPTGRRIVPPDAPLTRRLLHADRPHVRLRDVLLNTKWCFEIYGVIRRDALLRTGLHQSYYGTDKAVLAGLALLGPWCSVDEELFFRRCHATNSGTLTGRAREEWSRPGRRVGPRGAVLAAGYVRAVNRTPLPFAERVRCYAAVVGKAVERDNFANLVVPGPDNYFGIGAGRPAAVWR